MSRFSQYLESARCDMSGPSYDTRNKDGYEKELKSLGSANGWSKTPQIVLDCEKAGHELQGKNIGRCLNEYSCPICGYKYTVDSSD